MKKILIKVSEKTGRLHIKVDCTPVQKQEMNKPEVILTQIMLKETKRMVAQVLKNIEQVQKEDVK